MSGTADVTDPVAWTSQLSAMLSSGRAVSDMSDAETLVTRHVESLLRWRYSALAIHPLQYTTMPEYNAFSSMPGLRCYRMIPSFKYWMDEMGRGRHLSEITES